MLQRNQSSQRSAIIYCTFDDLGHRLLDQKVLSVNKRYHRIRAFFDRPDKFGVENKSLVIESGERDHIKSPIRQLNPLTSEHKQLLEQLICGPDNPG